MTTTAAADRKRRGFAIGLLAALVLFVVLGWSLGTESALRWGARQAERLSEGKLTLGAVRGSLYGPLRIEALTFQSPAMRIEVKEATLDWSPLALFRRQIRIARFALQELRVTELKPSTEPVKLPQTLHFPGTLAAPAITVGRLVLHSGGNEHVLSGIDLGLTRSADSYQIELRGLSSNWGTAQGSLMLDDTRPFGLSAHASLGLAKEWSTEVLVDASGTLEQIVLEAKAKTLGGDAAMRAKLAPFAEIPTAEAQIEANGIDPALLRKGLPSARLGASIGVLSRGEAALQGNFTVRNELPGPWDRSRLPLREISARFAGTPQHIELNAVRVDLAAAGRFTGDGQIGGNTLQLHLATTDFNPAQLGGKMHPMRLAGDITVQADAAHQRLGADLRDPRFRLHLDASHQDGVLELRDATIQAGAGKLSGHGRLALEGLRPFRLAGTLQGFDPADFGDYPAARINGLFSATGQLAGEPQASLSFAIADSRFRRHALDGQGSLSVSPSHIWNTAVSLHLAGNSLVVQGALGKPGDRLGVRIKAASLAMIDPQLGGKGQASATLKGRFGDPSGDFDAEFSDLSWAGRYRVAGVSANGRLDEGGGGALALDVRLRGVAAPQLRLDRVDVHAQGTRIEHVVRLLAKNPELDLESRLVGGWRNEVWSGQVTDLMNRGRHAFSLKAPAGLDIAKQGLRLGQTRFDIAGADLVLQDLTYDAGRLTSRGEFTGLVPARTLGRADPENDLSLGGEWRIAVGDSVNGHVALWRERGDLSIAGQPQVTLGLSGLALHLAAEDNRLEGRLEAGGTKLGSLKAAGQSLLSRRDGTWGIAGDTPVKASVELSVESLAWLQPLVDRSGALSFDGALKAQLAADGNFAQPRLAGTVSGDHLTLAVPDQGLQLKDGRFQAEVRDQVLHLKDLAARGGDGTLSGEGSLALTDEFPVMHLSLRAERLEVLSRPDRHLIVSGTGDVSFAGTTLRVGAKLKADRGLIELDASDALASSDDIVVLGRTERAQAKRPPYALDFDLDLDLGEQFYVKARGLDAQLGGVLKLNGAAGALPSALGSIHVVKGAYSAYGQRLEIDRGILNFQGPVDNPGLNIVALRKNQAVEAGVAVSGTAQAPSVRLVSSPVVPDTEKLSWLVLGHGIEDTKGNDINALQVAAGALLAAGDSVTLQQGIAHAAGLEEVSLKGAGGLESTVITLGKRLSSRAYLSFEQGLSGADSLVKINYMLTKRLSVRVQAGTTPALDLFYSFSFD